MNLPYLLSSSLFLILCQWTSLLALGWVCDWVLRRQHARWRLILWRGILCAGVVLPVVQSFEVPGIRIPIVVEDSPSESAQSLPAVAGLSAIPAATTAEGPNATPAKGSVAPAGEESSQLRTQTSVMRLFPWGIVVTGVWMAGFMHGVGRLIRVKLKLSRLQAAAVPAAPELQRLAAEIRARLEVRRAVGVYISDAVTSPFVCCIIKPRIILPATLARQLSTAEISGLLSHEIAHLRHSDLAWCVAWQCVKAVCWFHPLVWKVPAVHNLACEQEADRLASKTLGNQGSYSGLLAQLALRVLALPADDTLLTLNGGSQIALRLKHLARKGMGAWSWRCSAAGFGLVGALFLLTAGCHFSKARRSNSMDSSTVTFKTTLVVVQEESGKPIEGATIVPSGFRVKGRHGASAYGWNTKLFGAPEKAVTDREGKAQVKYPVEGIPEEKQLTGKLIFKVTHPEYASIFKQSYSVDSPEPPIQLTPGIALEVSGYFGADRQPVTELVPNLSEGLVGPEDWQKGTNGTFKFHRLSPGGHILQLMGRLPSGEVVFSDDVTFTAEQGKPYSFSLEMKPGIRVEGRLDDNVPRPVKNGRVLISVRPKQFPAWNNYADVDGLLEKYPHVRFWKSYRPIAEDGTFVFESVPPGGLDVVAHGAGFASQSGGTFSQRVGSKLERIPGFGLPQAFALTSPMTKIVVATELPATLEVTAKTKSGEPIEGVTVWVNPNIVRMGGIFGNMRQSSEEPFRKMEPLPDINYSASTGRDGIARIRNIPAFDRGVEVFHAQYEVPLQEPDGSRDRHIRTAYAPGATNKVEVSMESKGKSFIGSN